MGDLVSLLGGAFGGSVVGAIGAAVGKWFEAKQEREMKKLQIEQDKALNAHELQVMGMQAESALKQLEYKAFDSSLEADRATYSTGSTSGWLVAVDVVRGLIRPILTATLLIYCIVLVVYLTQHYDVAFSSTQVYDMVFMIINDLVTSMGLALAWWFGSRPARVGGKV